MITGNKIKSLTDAIAAIVSSNSARLNGIKIAPDDNTTIQVVKNHVEIIVADKAMTNLLRKTMFSAFIDMFDAVEAPRVGYQVLRAYYSYSGTETSGVTIFTFVIQEN